MKFLIILLFLIVVLIYYLLSIELFRYFTIKNIEDVKYYDDKYCKIPKVGGNRKVVISMTTIPSRINRLKPTITSLLDSSKRVDKIYLNIPKISCKGVLYHIPNWLKSLKNIEINYIEKDFGPATKLIPILRKENKKTIIIVIDDDVIYGTKMVENYIKTFYLRGKKEALTIFGSNIENGEICEEWPGFVSYRGGTYVSILKGHDSFLVTPEMFSSNVFNFDIAPKECFWVDDIWFSGWLKYNNVKIYSLGFQFCNMPITDMETIKNSESLCLSHNLSNSNNNKAISFFKDLGVSF